MNEPAKTEVKAIKDEPKIVYREKNRLSNIFTRSLLSLLLIACGIAIVWLMLQIRDKNTQINTINNQFNTVNTDKSSLQTQVYSLKDQVKKLSEAPDEAVASDNNAILKVAHAIVQAKVANVNDRDFEYTITKKSGDFAKVAVDVPNGVDYAMIFKKVNGVWVQIYEGWDKPTAAITNIYRIPADVQ